MKHKIFIATLAIAAAFCSCEKTNPTESEDEVDKELEELVSYIGTITIDYGSDAAAPTITGEVDDVSITTDGSYVTVVSLQENVVKYVLQGTTTNGGFKIYSESRFGIYMNNVNISNNDSCAINSQSSKRMYLVLPDGTSSIVKDGTGYPVDKEETGSGGEDKKGAIFSEGQIIVSGNGSLELYGNNKHALATDEYLRVRTGSISIKQSAADGLHPKSYYLQEGGSIDIACTKDAIQVSKGYFKITGGELTIVSQNDGILADYGDEPLTDTETGIDASIYISGGTLNITAQSKNKRRGIHAYNNIVIDGGSTTVTCSKRDSCTTVTVGVITENGGTITRNGN